MLEYDQLYWNTVKFEEMTPRTLKKTYRTAIAVLVAVKNKILLMFQKQLV